jgi:hypothetical protein
MFSLAASRASSPARAAGSAAPSPSPSPGRAPVSWPRGRGPRAVRREIEAAGGQAGVQPTDVTDLRQLGPWPPPRRRFRGGSTCGSTTRAGTRRSRAAGRWLEVTEAGWDRMLQLNLRPRSSAPRPRPSRCGTAAAAPSSSSAPSAGASTPRPAAGITRGVQGRDQQRRRRWPWAGPGTGSGQHDRAALVEPPLTAPWLATEADRTARAASTRCAGSTQPPDVAAAAVSSASERPPGSPARCCSSPAVP